MAVLNGGDTLEYSVSYYVRENGQECWVKMGATTTVNDGEDPEEARYRLTDFVNLQLSAAIAEVVAS